MQHSPKIILAFGAALLLFACGEEGTSEPIEYPEESSAEICSSSENAPVSSIADIQRSSSSEDLATSSSSDARSCSSLTESSSSFSSSSALSSSSLLVLPCKTETEDHCEYGSLYDERDGQTYKTVRIGNQIWMAENLNYAYLQPTATLDSSSWCRYNEPDSCANYGRRYIWSAAMDSAAIFSAAGKGFGDGVGCGTMQQPEPCDPRTFVRGVCPAGWHLPTVDEWYEFYPVTSDSDLEAPCSYGFCTHGLNFEDFWSSIGYESSSAFSFRQQYSEWGVRKDSALSVRCLKDTILGLGYVYQGVMTDLRDGQVYKTVTIKDQTWMLQNLNYGPVEGSSCYDDDESNCSKYGRLYTWGAAMDSAKTCCGYGKRCEMKVDVQGICPDGWHLPSKKDFELLIGAVKEINYYWFWNLLHLLSNSFSGVKMDGFRYAGYASFFYSSTESDDEGRKAYYFGVTKDDWEGVVHNINSISKEGSISVRCVKDVPD